MARSAEKVERWIMKQYLLGAVAAILVNLLTVLGWMTIGPFFPAAANALVALAVAGIWGLEDKWAFPMGYWTVQLLVIVFWLTGMGLVTQLST
jgi:hypothetical protein